MSTLAGQGHGGYRTEDGLWSERVLAWRPRVTWDVVVLGAIFLAGFALRFYDLGTRAIHHDESLHAAYSWYLYRGQGYVHDPLMHGPFLFHAMALVYGLIGVSDATARFVPAALGSALVLLPWLLRDRLGQAGALTAALLLAISPTMLYFSRFVGAGAQDIVLAVTALLIAAGVWRYLTEGRSRWLYLIAGALSVSFATKEVTFITVTIVLVWLNGLVAAGLATQRDLQPGRRLLWMALLFPVAWAIVALWPSLGWLRSRAAFVRFPRSADLLLLLGVFTAPQFAAAVQIPLERAGFAMDAPSRIGNLTNEALFGAVVVGVLLTATTLAGLAWRRRDFPISAAIFWAIYVLLFTTFFTNFRGFASGIWGSLDYWLEQHGELRGEQPVYYYATITPIYEYLALVLAAIAVITAAVRGGWASRIALLAGVAFVLLGVWYGEGNVRGIPFAVLAALALLVALRRDLFRSFLAFWVVAVFYGLSVSGEKMPWLEVHIALPLALLAALAVRDVVGGLASVPLLALTPRPPLPLSGEGEDRVSSVEVGAPLLGGEGPEERLAGSGASATPPRRANIAAVAVAAFAAFGGAALLFWPGDEVARGPAVLGALALAVAASLAAGWRAPHLLGVAGVAALLALLAPLTVRDAWRAAFTHADTPKEMLIYTQTSPRLKEISKRVDELARVSGQGRRLPITVDSAEAFTWPWAWYLRDYGNVIYTDLTQIARNPQPASAQRPGAVLITLAGNAQAVNAWPGVYGPGERFPHRWWFPESYRDTTARRFWKWVRDPARWAAWRDFYLERELPSTIGSIDAVAYVALDQQPASGSGRTTAGFRPRREGGQLIVGGAGAVAGALSRPAGVAVDRDGNVIVADSLNNRVQKFSPEGELLATSGGDDRFREPWGVAAGADGEVYVADTWNHRIVKLDAELRLLQAWGGSPPQPGMANPAPLELYGPRDIAVDGEGNLWVTDTGNARVVKFSAEGRSLGTYGGRGSGPGQFQEPVGIAVASNGELFVADTWNGRVQRFDDAFRHLGEIRVTGWEGPGVENKPYLDVLEDGSILITVPDAGRLLRLNRAGRQLGSWDRFGDTLTGARPLGVAVAGEGRVWVADGASSQLVRLRLR